MDVRLRAIEESDLSQLRDWRNDDRLRCNVREHRLLNMINQRDWLEHISRSYEVEMFGIEMGGVLVGVCGLCYIKWVNLTAEVAIGVPDDRPDQGIAIQALKLLRRKAFEEFNLHRLWVETYEFHEDKLRLFEDAGFQLEGRLRKHVFKLGKYRDSLVYGLLREDV